MTADRDPETLALFIEESQEALQRIDQQLVDAERGQIPDNLMASLFRDIHTMKGSAGFLDFAHTQRLAHVTEDLLAKLRDGTIAAEASHFALLMKSVDVLRQFLESIRDTSDEAAINTDELVAQLHDAMSGPASSADSGGLVNPHTASVQAHDDANAPGDHNVAIADDSLQSASAEAKHDIIFAAKTEDAAKPTKGEIADGTVRVNVSVLDSLMNLIGELVLARNQIVQIVKSNRDGVVNAQAACQRLSLVTSDLQEQIMKTRMQPVARVFEKIPRMVRDLCQQTNKRVTPVIDGNATEIDKALVEAIRDPVLHIVRNAIDHGIEYPEERIRSGKSAIGKLSVRAAHEGGTVTIEIRDDGKGMDPVKLRAHAVNKGLLNAAQAERLNDREALDLVFRPGFSTAAKVTDLSGRGVGMDVVRTHIERAGGQVELDSIAGKGTTIRLKMPLTLAIIPALLVRSGMQRFAIPQVNLLELVHLDDERATVEIEAVRNASIYRLRGEVLPLVFLDRTLQLEPRTQGGLNIVVVSVGARRYGIVVDEVHETEEIVIKPLLGQLKRIPAYSGATVLGDGGVALILEVAGIAAMNNMDVSSQRRTEAIPSSTSSTAAGPQPYLIFSSGENGRCAVPLSMVSRLEHIPVERIERTAGQEVVQYRGSIMPIVRPEAAIPLGNQINHGGEQAMLVFDFGCMVGMAVNSIVDVTHVDRQHLQADCDNSFVLGRTVVLGATTLVLDVYGLVRHLAPRFVPEQRQHQHRPRILLADPSDAMRAATALYLQNAGADVVTASSVELAVREVSRSDQPLDALITDMKFHDGGGFELLQAAHTHQRNATLILWTHQDADSWAAATIQFGVHACISKLEREQLLASLQNAGVLKKPGVKDELNVSPGGDRSEAA